MALSEQLIAEIESMMAGLKKEDFERSGMGQKKFLDVVISINAQITKDRQALVNAGLDEKSIALFDGLQEMFVLTYGQRYGIVNPTSEERQHFDQQYKKVVTARKYMLVVARHVVDSCGDKKAERNYKFIVKGSGILDTLTDVILLEALIGQFPQYASQIKPGGIAIDPAFIQAAAANVVELLRSKGFVVEQGIPQNANVITLNRIITLLVRAIVEIKKYAEAAFIEDPLYYNDNYVLTTTPKPGESDVEEDVTVELKEPVAAGTN